MGRSITRREALALAGLGAIAGAAGCSAPGQQGAAGKEPQVESVEPLEDTSDWDAAFYKPAYGSAEEARVAAEAVAEEVEAGGIVLLRNEGGTLPLASGTRVSLLGRGAADPVYDGTGAAFIDLAHAVDLRSACVAAGLSVNDAAFDFLAAEAPNRPRAAIGTLDAPETVSYYLGEIPWSAYPQDVRQSMEGTVGVVVISRPSGEGADLSQDLLGSLESGGLPDLRAQRRDGQLRGGAAPARALRGGAGAPEGGQGPLPEAHGAAQRGNDHGGGTSG